MTQKKILTIPDPVLRKVSEPVKIVNAEIKKLMDDMLETMYAAPGIGLAAVQIGILKRIIVIDLSKEGEKKKPIFIVNPEIISKSSDLVSYEEGCLSIPGMSGLVKRYKKIKYEGFDMNGNIIKKEAEGLEARVVQHEYDHLMGILYTSRLVDEKAFGFSEEIEDFWKNQSKDKKDNNEFISS